MTQAPSIKEALPLHTICDDCGKEILHDKANWADDGSSYCPSCRTLEPMHTRAALATLQPSGERREAIARIICKAKGVSPDCLHQNYDDEPVDHTDAKGRTYHYGWRNQLHIVDAILASGLVQDEAGWRDINTAPKDGTKIIYLNKFGEIGFCYWSEAGSSFDESLWWDDHADDECVPMYWLPPTYLPPPPIRSARNGGAET